MIEYNGYRIVGDGTFGMKNIQTIGRGSLPAILRGSFSSSKEAMIAINIALAEKVDKNGQSKRSD